MTSVDLTGKVAIITGGAGGFGRALVKAFVDSGARVAVCDIAAGAVVSIAAGYGSDRALAVPADIADPEACADVVRKTLDHFGGLHILINNAALGMGTVRADHFTRCVQIEDIEIRTWQDFMAVNMNGAFYLAKAAIPIFRQQKWGRIVNVTTSFFTMLRPGFSPYGAAKAALEAWSASLATELKDSGITVNVVVPGGPADTSMVPPDAGFDRSKLVAPERMAPPKLWLSSDEAADVTACRFVAAEWDPANPPTDPLGLAGPVGWPNLGMTPVWPDAGPRPHRTVF
jgi:NAD(P)-dependent dehydrogenase (short-subunit alcohol dehydrogenase family)